MTFGACYLEHAIYTCVIHKNNENHTNHSQRGQVECHLLVVAISTLKKKCVCIFNAIEIIMAYFDGDWRVNIWV